MRIEKNISRSYNVVAILFLLLGCESQAEIQKNNLAEQKFIEQFQQSRTKATSTYNSNSQKWQQICISKYQSNMNDPKSFQLAGDWQHDFYVEDLPGEALRLGFAPGDAIFETKIRGKNAFGALMLSNLRCGFSYGSQGMQFDQATDKPSLEDIQ